MSSTRPSRPSPRERSSARGEPSIRPASLAGSCTRRPSVRMATTTWRRSRSESWPTLISSDTSGTGRCRVCAGESSRPRQCRQAGPLAAERHPAVPVVARVHRQARPGSPARCGRPARSRPYAHPLGRSEPRDGLTQGAFSPDARVPSSLAAACSCTVNCARGDARPGRPEPHRARARTAPGCRAVDAHPGRASGDARPGGPRRRRGGGDRVDRPDGRTTHRPSRGHATRARPIDRPGNSRVPPPTGRGRSRRRRA